jgi:hypothetical protein
MEKTILNETKESNNKTIVLDSVGSVLIGENLHSLYADGGYEEEGFNIYHTTIDWWLHISHSDLIKMFRSFEGNKNRLFIYAVLLSSSSLHSKEIGEFISKLTSSY